MRTERRISTSQTPRIDFEDANVRLIADPAMPCHVLIVDDDPKVVARISSLLRSGGYVTHSA
jgi:PleD family two-component response regulator